MTRRSSAMDWSEFRRLPRGEEIARSVLGGEKPKGEPRRGRMNKLEAMYAQHLESERMAHRIARWSFEGIKLRVGAPIEGKRPAYFTCDFNVWDSHGRLTFHEVKGYRWREQMAKLRAAAELYPEHPFALCEWVNGAWRIQWLR